MPARKPHRLKENKSSQFPRNWIFVDTESCIQEHGLTVELHFFRLGAAIYWRCDKSGHTLKEVECRFYRPSEFWEFVDKVSEKDRRVIIVGFNIGFDIRLLDGFSEPIRRGYILKSFYMDQRTTLMTYKNEKRTIQVIDAANFFHGRLEDWAGLVGLKKIDVDFYSCSDSELMDHCVRDVEILKELWKQWIQFLHVHNFGCFGRTLPSQSFNAFRHRFYNGSIYIHDNVDATNLERSSYYGGRCSVFRAGIGENPPYWHIDVNSLYPYIMRETKVPVKFIGIHDNVELSWLTKQMSRFHVIGSVYVNCDLPCIPYKSSSSLIFPVGQFNTVLSHSELDYSISMFMVEKVYSASLYEKQSIFRDYVEYLYDLRMHFRKKGNRLYERMCKLMMNSLYGKFGQRGMRWELVDFKPNLSDSIEEMICDDTGSFIRQVVISGHVFEFVDEGESYNSFPAIAAEITSAARVYLWELISTAGEDHVWYCDTDSLIVDEAGYKSLTEYLDDNELGKLKLVQKINNLHIHAPKQYEADGTVKCKGVPSSAETLADNKYQYLQFEGIRGALNNRRLNYVYARRVNKRISEIFYPTANQLSSSISPPVLSEPLESSACVVS